MSRNVGVLALSLVLGGLGCGNAPDSTSDSAEWSGGSGTVTTRGFDGGGSGGGYTSQGSQSALVLGGDDATAFNQVVLGLVTPERSITTRSVDAAMAQIALWSNGPLDSTQVAILSNAINILTVNGYYPTTISAVSVGAVVDSPVPASVTAYLTPFHLSPGHTYIVLRGMNDYTLTSASLAMIQSLAPGGSRLCLVDPPKAT